MFGCECCVDAKFFHSSSLTWRDRHMKHIKDKIHIAQNRRYDELLSRFYETYKNAVKPHGFHTKCTDSDMAMKRMYTCN